MSEGGDSSHNLVISPWTTGCYGWVSYSGCLQCMPPRKLMSFLFIFSISQIAIEKKKNRQNGCYFLLACNVCVCSVCFMESWYTLYLFSNFQFWTVFTSVYCIYVQSITIVGKLCWFYFKQRTRKLDENKVCILESCDRLWSIFMALKTIDALVQIII